MDAQHERHASNEQHGGDPVADDIESRNPDSGDIVAGEQVLDEGHIAPDQDGGPSRIEGNRPEQPAEGAENV